MYQVSNMNRKKLQKQAEALSRIVKHFNKSEVESLMKLFQALVGSGSEKPSRNGLDRNKFRNILHNTFGMTDDMIMDRVFRAFDKDNDSYINVTEWVQGLSVFLRGTLDERIKYCFDVYDLNGDGYISREEMFHMLKNSLLKQPTEEDPDEGVKDLVEITLKKMDYDHDGKLSFADFEKAVHEESLLLEAFGPCLPDMKRFNKRRLERDDSPVASRKRTCSGGWLIIWTIILTTDWVFYVVLSLGILGKNIMAFERQAFVDANEV